MSNSLSDNLLLEKLKSLYLVDIIQLCQKDSRIKEFCENDTLWVALLSRDFPNSSRSKPQKISNRKWYFELLQDLVFLDKILPQTYTGGNRTFLKLKLPLVFYNNQGTWDLEGKVESSSNLGEVYFYTGDVDIVTVDYTFLVNGYDCSKLIRDGIIGFGKDKDTFSMMENIDIGGKSVNPIVRQEKIYGFPFVRKLQRGEIVSEVYVVRDAGNIRVLRVYETIGFSLMPEIDILMRLRHPSIVRGYKITFYGDPDPDAVATKYSLLVEYANCSNVYILLKEVYEYLCGVELLYENGYSFHDIHTGNYCTTPHGIKLYDFNITRKVSYITSRKEKKVYNYGTHMLEWIQASLTFLTNPLDKELRDDLLKRIDNYSIDLRDIRTHPLFRNYNKTYIKGAYEHRYINFNDWPVKHLDYFSSWRSLIGNKNAYSRFRNATIKDILQTLDLYYRYLPFVNSDYTGYEDIYDKLEGVIISCLSLTFSINYSSDSKYSSRFYADKDILTNLKGQIGSQFLYNKCTSFSDYLVCWNLAALPYDEYMKLLPERFYEVIPPNCQTEIPIFADFIGKVGREHPLLNDTYILPDQELVRQLQSPSTTPPEIRDCIFSKLTVDEAEEFLDLHGIEYEKFNEKEHVKFYLADGCKRLLIYLIANQEEPLITEAVNDLVYHLHPNIEMTQQYQLEDLLNMDNNKIREFALMFNLPPESTTKERVIRLLRMNYLIENY